MTGLPELQDSRLTLDAGVATLTFNRDDVRNALTGTALAADLLAVIDWAAATRSASVLVMTGGGKAFCAGGNVKQMPEMAALPAHVLQGNYRQDLQKLPRALADTDLVLIAAVNGPAVGAGCDLALMCDLRIAARGASFAEAYVNLGLVPAMGGPWLLQRHRLPARGRAGADRSRARRAGSRCPGPGARSGRARRALDART